MVKESLSQSRIEVFQKKLFSGFSYDGKKSKVGDEQEKKKKKKVGQNVRYRFYIALIEAGQY